MGQAVATKLSALPARCDDLLRQLVCGLCSADQDNIFTVQPFETDMLLCPAFANEIFSACSSAQFETQSVSSRFGSAAEFLHALLETASVHVSVRQRPECYNPLLRRCDRSDYIGVYGDCENGSRTAFFSLSPLAECQGGLSTPAAVHGLPCDTVCLSGKYLPVGSTTCENCSAGSFSIGGGIHIEHAWKDWPHGVTASNYCLDRRTNTEEEDRRKCFHWQMNDTALVSGAIGDNLVTVLDLGFEMVRVGHVSFRWQVDAELCPDRLCDGFYAELDGIRIVNFTSVAPWTETRVAVSKGLHTLTFAYSKDISISKGADMAMIDMIEMNGLFFADSSCIPCPPGSISAAGSRNCTVCPKDTYSEGTHCEPCPSTEYAPLGSAVCFPRAPCTMDDYEFLYTECDSSWRMSKVAEWITPKICGGGVSKPATVYDLPCFACPPGFFRRVGSGDCIGCPDGNRLSPTSGQCEPCTAGTHARKVLEASRWDEWPDWVHHSTGRPLTATLEHGCRGPECSDEWRLMHDHIDSGPSHGHFAEPWLNFTVDLETSPSYFAFNHSFVNCSDCRVMVEVVRAADGAVIDTQTFYPWSSTRGMRTLEAGFHRCVIWFFLVSM